MTLRLMKQKNMTMGPTGSGASNSQQQFTWTESLHRHQLWGWQLQCFLRNWEIFILHGLFLKAYVIHTDFRPHELNVTKFYTRNLETWSEFITSKCRRWGESLIITTIFMNNVITNYATACPLMFGLFQECNYLRQDHGNHTNVPFCCC
jgi:1-aminocyclopropane-1-carboxylate deaminase/D-cysteine desulfhydrase-like pyridoxal-dependent ACC family enzyme